MTALPSDSPAAARNPLGSYVATPESASAKYPSVTSAEQSYPNIAKYGRTAPAIVYLGEECRRVLRELNELRATGVGGGGPQP